MIVFTVAQKRQRSGDHFHARADIERRQREMQSRGARVHGQRVRNIGIGAEFLLELRGPGAGRKPAGLKRANHFVDFFVSNAGTVIGYLQDLDCIRRFLQ